MHTFSSEANASPATSRLFSRVVLPLVAAAFAFGVVAAAGAADSSDAAAKAQADAMGAPVNVYAPGADVYASHEDGEIHPWHVKGQIWLMAGEPAESNVAVQMGDEGVLVVDAGTQAMAPKLLEQIKRLASVHAGDQKAIRIIVNTNGLLDHIGGNPIVRGAGSEIIAGEEAAQQATFGTKGAEVLAEQNVLTRLSQSPGEATQDMWPTDAEDFDVYNSFFNGEAVQLYHPLAANTDGQLIAQFRESDVIAAGDVVDMNTYPIIDVTKGGTIDGELIALNNLTVMAVPERQVEGGTVVIPGHGRLCDVSDVQQYAIMVTTIRNRVQFYKNQGKTLEQVLALKPSGDYDVRWGGGNGSWTAKDFVTAVFKTLPAKGPVYFEMHTVTTVPTSGKASAGRVF